MRKCLQTVSFCIFLVLGIGQLPTAVGRAFLLMALMLLPVKSVQKFVDAMLNELSRRYMCFVLLLFYLYCLPVEEISEAGKQMGLFLRALCDLLGIM